MHKLLSYLLKRIICWESENGKLAFYVFPFFFSFIFISWRLITLQYCSGFCHTLTWVSHGFTCVPHPDCPSHLPPRPIHFFNMMCVCGGMYTNACVFIQYQKIICITVKSLDSRVKLPGSNFSSSIKCMILDKLISLCLSLLIWKLEWG